MPDLYAKLARILADQYGVGLVAAPAIAVLWAAADLAREVGADEAKVQLRAANRRRESMGRCPALPAYGHELF